MARGRAKSGWVAAAALIAVAALIAGLWWFTRPAPPPEPAFDDVTVTRSTQAQTVSLAGTIEPQQQSTVTFAVPGTVDEVRVKVGDRVKRGATLARVDERDLAAASALARAQLDAALAALDLAEDAETTTDAQLSAARAQVKSAQASLTNADNRLADATLVSPIDGTIAAVDYAVGDQVSGATGAAGELAGASQRGATGAAAGASGLGGALSGLGGASQSSGIVVIATDAWQLNATVGTADLPKLRAGQTALVTPTGTTSTVRGVVDTVGVVAETDAGSSASFPVTVKITDTQTPLFAGSKADAVITVETVPDVLTVPVAAVTRAESAATVRRVTDGVARETPVSLGRRFGSAIEVTSGLAEGDVVRMPKAQSIAKPTQPLYGPNGRYASSATPSETPR